MKRKIEIPNEPKYFYCRSCGCLFEADRDDYKLVTEADKQIAMTSCPDCGREVAKEVRR